MSLKIRERVEKVYEQIGKACSRANRNPSEITVVAVSKSFPPQLIKEAWDAGLRIFGENYAQELVQKAKILESSYNINPRWHFVGHLQTNKVKKVLPFIEVIHSVDSVKLLTLLEREAKKLQKKLIVLFEVNIGNEISKTGCKEEELPALIEEGWKCESVLVRGLMCIPPRGLSPEFSRPYFRKLRELRDRFGGKKSLPELSMGMTDDFEVAIEEGATIIRLGRAIFGERT